MGRGQNENDRAHMVSRRATALRSSDPNLSEHEIMQKANSQTHEEIMYNQRQRRLPPKHMNLSLKEQAHEIAKDIAYRVHGVHH